MKIFNIALASSFVVTVLPPLTGIHVHKLASVIFLILALVHTWIYRKKMGRKYILLMAIVILSFVTGLFGMILDQYPVILILHRSISIAVVFFMAIHIFIYHRRLKLVTR